MRNRLRKIGLWLAIIFAAALLASVWRLAVRYLDVTAVQNAVPRQFEIVFGPANSVRSRALPEPLDNLAQRLIYRFSDETGSRGTINNNRLRAVFLGPVREIHIIDPDDFDDKLGAALMRFPEVRELEVTVQIAESPGPEAWTQLCASLRTLPHLQKLELGGTGLTDEAMAQFANHPELRRITIIKGHLTPAVARTLATLPRLTHVTIDEQFDAETNWPAESKKAMRAALPAVHVKLR